MTRSRISTERRAREAATTLAAGALCGALVSMIAAEIRTFTAGQEQTSAFEVVSVKGSVSGDERSASFVEPGGRYRAVNATVRMLIRTAYGVHDDQIVGGPGLPEPNPPSPCDSGFTRSGHLAARGVEFSTLVTQRSAWADRVVLDRTGLSDRFDRDLQWNQEPLSTTATDAHGVSLATAMQEQLGLKLESQRAPTDVLVVARVERPMPD